MYPILFSLGPLTIPTFGIFALMGFFFGSFVIWKRARETHFSEEDIFDGILLVTLAGLVGARIVYILLHFSHFGFWPFGWLSLLRIPGLTFVGGLVMGLSMLNYLSRRRHWDFYEISDIFVTGFSLVQAIGWLGAFFSGTGVGRESKLGFVFPGYETPHFPAQLIWMVGCALLFILLWRVEQRYRTYEWYRAGKVSAANGFLTFSYFIVLGILQLGISLSVGTRVYWWGFPADLFLGVCMLGTGVAGLYRRSGRSLTDDRIRLYDFIVLGIRKGVVTIRQFDRKVKGIDVKARKS